MLRTTLPILLCWLMQACSNPAASRPVPPAKAALSADDKAQSNADQAVLALMDLTLVQEGRPIARLFADGRAQGTAPDSTGRPGRWIPGPTFHADGTIVMTRHGVRAKVRKSGEIYVSTPKDAFLRQHLFGRIVGDEFRYRSEEKWTVRVEGDALLFNNGVPPNRITGVTVDARVRHTVLVMFAAFLLDMAIEPPATDGHAGP